MLAPSAFPARSSRPQSRPQARPQFRPQFEREEEEDEQLLIEEEEEEEIVEEDPRTLVQVKTRRPAPGVPRRRARPRPSQNVNVAREQNQVELERGQSQDSRRPTPVGTSERYSHMNEDGSFTFGYVSEDGSFREETRGVDCITRGKYGYIDPDGMKREFTYVSGLPCEIGEDGKVAGEDEDENELQNIEDPIAPGERFRTTQAVQLNDDEIPDSARPRTRQPIRRPEEDRQPVQRVRDPAPASARRPNSQNGGSAFESLLQIADQEESGPPPTRRPNLRTRPTPTRIAARPEGRPTQKPGAFDFDQELEGFALNRPALTFDEEGRRQEAGPPRNQGPNFASELVFNPETGTFQTELRQTVPGGEINLAENDAPSGFRQQQPQQQTPRTSFAPTPAPPQRTFSATPIPSTATSARPFTAFSQSSPASPGPVQFEPLSFPDPSSVTPRGPTTPVPGTPTPGTPRPQPSVTPTPARNSSPSPSPTNSFFFQPFSTAGQPPSPTPTASRPTPRPSPATPSPFALGPRPVEASQASSTPFPTQSRPQPPTPQLQFGFNPIQQQQQRQQQQQPGRPFTAFSAGVPPQLNGANPPFQRAPPPPQFQRGPPPPQFQRNLPPPPPPQGQFQRGPPQGFGPRPNGPPQQLGIPPQLQQQGGRFLDFNRPPPSQGNPQPQGGFAVFNPASLQGA